MKCFSFKHKKAKPGGSTPRHRSAPDAAPSTTFFTPVSGRSNVDTVTSSSYCSSAATLAQQTSKSMDSSVASPRSMPALYEERAHNLKVFDYRELRVATDNFSRLRKIGEGGFGSVYKGVIKTPPLDGQKDQTVAIKKLNQNGLQGHKQWLAEVQFLAVVEHPNLVKLLGYCALDGERGIDRLLVYEFMPNKSLEDHLFNKAYPVLPWNTRLKIILGVAQGLDYLHEGLEVQVIYRDFKASNVLLDEEFRPKLSDFGLAREGPSEGRTHVTTAVVGTYGYAAPEYVETGHLTTKSDVWSFGVVLYEILAGRRSLNRNLPKTEQKLLEWVKQFPVDSRKFSTIIDPRLGNQYSRPAARLIAKLANSCLLKNQKERPTMKEVIEHLKNAIKLTEAGCSSDLEPAEEQHSSSDLESEEKGEQLGSTKSFQRRIEHLGRMRESLKVENKRGFMIMQRGNQT